MKNDQWFEPGDKVMRVTTADSLGLPHDGKPTHHKTDFGSVLSVSYCEKNIKLGNAVYFVGIKNYPFHACCFRKVEEIRLCVEAVKRVEKTEAVEA